jgi:hypothetical protein
MPMRRILEFTQFDKEKSIFWYAAPNGSAGLHLRLVSGPRRVPFPPARITAVVFRARTSLIVTASSPVAQPEGKAHRKPIHIDLFRHSTSYSNLSRGLERDYS